MLTERELEVLYHRTMPLLVGVYGHTDDTEGKRTVRVGGSGIFIAPFRALTARHVSRDLFRTDPYRFDDLNRRTSGYFTVPHSSGLFHLSSTQDKSSVIWSVTHTWDPVFTDICLMEAALDAEASTDKNVQMPSRFLDWSLEPPPVGADVAMLGYPSTDITVVNEKQWQIQGPRIAQKGRVLEVFPTQHDAGMYNFPCFAIDEAVDPGFSGGAVIWQSRLCGIVSGGLGGRTMAASLWPLCMMEYEYPDHGSLGGKRAFSELFEQGTIQAAGWRALKHRATSFRDNAGRLKVELT